MKQYPSRLNFRKYHKPKAFFLSAIAQKAFYPLFGNFGLLALNSARLNFRQIEAGRRSIRRSVSKQGKVSIRVFTYASLTKRPVGMRMGKGKGAHNSWVCPIKKGQIIYELSGIPEYKSFIALSKAADKLPMKCKVISLTY